jgi:hypothetical protein
MLTLYIITCDKPELHQPKKAIDSFGDIMCIYCKMTHRNIRKEIQDNPIVTDWYGYIFSDEMIDENAKKALPIYLEQGGFDSLVMMKKELNGDKPKITQAPRIFHKSIVLEENIFLPENPDECKFERMLDGWILPND